MSIYAIHKICFHLRNDPAFRERMQKDPVKVLEEFPLNEEEHAALTKGDIYALHQMGAHAYLLQTISSAKLFGVNSDNYQPRIRGQERPH